MKLKIEYWISEQKFSSKVTPLFDEAIKSYKASAYKASLLFSYLAFMTIIKERLVSAQSPSGIPSGMWNQIIRDIQNRESWDKKVFEAIQTQRPAVIFPISDTIRREVVYWKDRRNDCAHFKHEKIDYHHVESFWSFLDTNLGRFSVRGGSAALLIKLQNHFDPSLTPPDADIEPLITEIESAVDSSELRSFYNDLDSNLSGTFENNNHFIYDKIIGAFTGEITDELIEFLKNDEARLLAFIRLYPERIQFLNLSARFVRSLWYDKLFSDLDNDFDVYAALLRNNLIRPQDIQNANDRIVNRLRNDLPNSGIMETLKQSGFYDVLKDSLFPSGGIFPFAKANMRKDLIIHYLNEFDMDDDIARGLCKTFDFPYTPSELKMRLRKWVTDNPDKKTQFNDCVDGIPGLSIPSDIDFMKR